MKSITLIGMPGVGKSTFGKRLAKSLGWEFIDTDLVIAQKLGTSLQAHINHAGDQAFMREEEAAVLSLPMKPHCIISPGGSIVYSTKAMTHLKAFCKIIYLEDSLSRILHRIPNLQSRGIVGLGNKPIEILFNERDRLYTQYADLTLHLEGKDDKIILETLEKECR